MQKLKREVRQMAKFDTVDGGPPNFNFGLRERQRRAPGRPLRARNRGRTPIDQVGPRWSVCGCDLRNLGAHYETMLNTYDGPFWGTHARFFRHSPVQLSEDYAA